MRHLLRGSTPPLIIGGTPAGIACAAALVAHGVAPTLVANGTPLGGRARWARVGSSRLPLFPDVFSQEGSLLRDRVSEALVKAHAGGCVIQKNEHISGIHCESNRITEVSVVGLLGTVRRRPRLVILADELIGPLSPPSNKGSVPTGDETRGRSYFHFVATENWMPGPQFGSEGWVAQKLSPPSKRHSAWCVYPTGSKTAPEEWAKAELMEDSGVRDLNTFRRTAMTEEQASSRGAKAAEFHSFSNVICLGERATGAPLAVEEEMESTRDLVNGWFSEPVATIATLS